MKVVLIVLASLLVLFLVYSYGFANGYDFCKKKNKFYCVDCGVEVPGGRPQCEDCRRQD